MKKWFRDAGIADPRVLMHFCTSNFAATLQMLPKMLFLLQRCHAADQKLNKWYFHLQKSIQNHYRTEGNCLFFGDAKDILSGEKDLHFIDMSNFAEMMQGLNLQ